MREDFEPMKIERTTVAESVAQKILEMIQANVFSVGDLLPTEKEFTELFGVGRSTIREALQALQSVGVIERRQGNGTYIKSTTVSTDSCFNISKVLQRYSLIELSEARKIIEEQSVALAAMNSSDESISAMQEANNRLRFNLGNADKREIVNLDFQVHRAITEGAGNTFLLEMLDMLLGIFLDVNESVLTREKTEIAIDFHQKIIDQIKAHDPKAARRLMTAHLTDVHERIIRENYESGENK